jgi:hypothetical protein
MKNIFQHIFIKHYKTYLFIFFSCSFIGTSKIVAQHFETRKTNEGIEILENGKKVLFYQQQPKSLNGKL